MHTQQQASSSFLHRLLSQQWFLGTLAMLEIIFGFILLGFPFILGTSLIVVLGVMLSLMAIMRCIHLVQTRKHYVHQGLAILIYAALGVTMLLSPLVSLTILTLALGIGLLLLGTVRFISTLFSQQRRARVWRFCNAIISLLLGAVVCYTWPASALWLLGLLVAIEMIFSGWTLLFLTLSDVGEKETESVN